MFTGITENEGASANKRSELVAGIYTEQQFTFASEDGTVELMLRQFTLGGAVGCSVIDSLLIDSNKDEVIFQDFILTATGEWRAGNGSKSFNLLDLWPSDFVDMHLISQLDAGDVIEVFGERNEGL